MKKQIEISLFLLAVFCVAPVFAQENSTDQENLAAKFREIKAEFSSNENQCEAFGKYDFKGTLVSFNLVDVEFRDFLTAANPFGCNFVIDEAVGKVRVNMKVTNFSWNLALQSVLESLDLAVKVDDQKFRIVKARDKYSPFFLKPEETTLHVDFVKLNYLALLYKSRCFPPEKKIGAANYKENPDKFLNLLRKMLSSRQGEILFDSRSHTLIVIDEKDRIKKISEFVKLLDESGFMLEEIVNHPNFEIK